MMTTHRYADTYVRLGGSTSEQGPSAPGARSHAARLPFDLPADLERFGLCSCRACQVGHSCAWTVSCRALSHTEDWRTLSWYAGDEAANWLCAWCDLLPDARLALRFLCTIADLAWDARVAQHGEDAPRNATHVRHVLYAAVRNA